MPPPVFKAPGFQRLGSRQSLVLNLRIFKKISEKLDLWGLITLGLEELSCSQACGNRINCHLSTISLA